MITTGDLVTRKSYNNDIVFEVIEIDIILSRSPLFLGYGFLRG